MCSALTPPCEPSRRGSTAPTRASRCRPLSSSPPSWCGRTASGRSGYTRSPRCSLSPPVRRSEDAIRSSAVKRRLAQLHHLRNSELTLSLVARPSLQVAVLTVSLLSSFVGGALANQKVCRSLEQRYEQIEKAATTIEVNATLFSAADKGCPDLAKRLLEQGASLAAQRSMRAPSTARRPSIKLQRRGASPSPSYWWRTAPMCGFPGAAASRRS